MLIELDKLTRKIENDNDILSVILTGAVEGIFMTHYDTREMVETSLDTPVVADRLFIKLSMTLVNGLVQISGMASVLMASPLGGFVEIRRGHQTFLSMNRMNKVFIAAINGNARGAGYELALACDLRLFSTGPYHISQPEVSHGIIPGGSQRLTHIVGAAKTMQLLLMAEELSPDEALELGVVNELCTPDELLPKAITLATHLSNLSPLSISAVKRAVYLGTTQNLPSGLTEESIGFATTLASKHAIKTLDAYNLKKAFDIHLIIWLEQVKHSKVTYFQQKDCLNLW